MDNFEIVKEHLHEAWSKGLHDTDINLEESAKNLLDRLEVRFQLIRQPGAKTIGVGRVGSNNNVIEIKMKGL